LEVFDPASTQETLTFAFNISSRTT
jgi:hypothetical protein